MNEEKLTPSDALMNKIWVLNLSFFGNSPFNVKDDSMKSIYKSRVLFG